MKMTASIRAGDGSDASVALIRARAPRDSSAIIHSNSKGIARRRAIFELDRKLEGYIPLSAAVSPDANSG